MSTTSTTLYAVCTDDPNTTEDPFARIGPELAIGRTQDEAQSLIPKVRAFMNWENREPDRLKVYKVTFDAAP
jgi:hypothetical protein